MTIIRGSRTMTTNPRQFKTDPPMGDVALARYADRMKMRRMRSLEGAIFLALPPLRECLLNFVMEGDYLMGRGPNGWGPKIETFDADTWQISAPTIEAVRVCENLVGKVPDDSPQWLDRVIYWGVS